MPRERREIPWLKTRDGAYYVYWYDAASNRTKRLSLNTRESVEAQARYAAFLAGGHEIFRGPTGTTLGVSVALDQYKREHVDLDVVDQRRAQGIIQILKEWFKNTPLQDVDIPACRAYADARTSGKLLGSRKGKRNMHVALSTVRRELGLLQAAANHAAAWKRIGQKANPPTPMPSIELAESGEGRLIFLTKAELACAIGKATGRLRDFMQVLYATGARRRSVERLTRFQVDLRGGMINLTSPHESKNERRSNKRRPRVPIDARIRPIIERLMMECERTGSEWLWGDKADMYQAFNDHMKAIGLADKAFPHVMRHSRATHLLMDGVPIYHVAKRLGDTIATVERVYGHVIPEELATDVAEGGQ